jgi:hypothetical protein
MNTNDTNNLDTSQYTFIVRFINPPMIGNQNYNITTYSINNYAKQTSLFNLTANTPNILNIIFSQSNPYFG